MCIFIVQKVYVPLGVMSKLWPKWIKGNHCFGFMQLQKKLLCQFKFTEEKKIYLGLLLRL